MSFGDRMKEVLEQSWSVSKDFAVKAGQKATDLGERGLLMLDIKQLESQAQKLISRLGSEAFIAFTERNQNTIERDSPEIKAVLDQISMVKDAIEKKEAELKDRKPS